MSTLTFVQHCRYASNIILDLCNAGSEYYNDDGSLDTQFYQMSWDIAVQTVEHLIAECTNPTLPSYINMVESALALKLINE